MAGQYEERDHSMMPWPAHGGRLSELAHLFPEAPKPWIDLSTGINPHPYPFTQPDNALLARLPDPMEEEALRHAAAEAYGVSSSCVLAAPGTQLLIGLLPGFLMRRQAVAGVRILSPTYSGHEAAWRAVDIPVQPLPHGAALSLPERHGVSVICAPNNPTGHVLTLAEIASLAETHERANALLIIDEAYADFAKESAASLLPHPSLIVLRSFGKAYGLAGMRIGFLLGMHPVVQALRTAIGPWAISTAGCHIAAEALRDRAWRSAMGRRLESEMAALRHVVTRAGLNFVGGTSLFGLFRSPDASVLWERLARAGILVRRFDWDASLLRFGLPADETGLTRLAEVLHAGKA